MILIENNKKVTLNKENIFIKNLKYEYFYEDMLNDKLLIISKHIKIKGIYLLYNKSTLKYYIGSSNNLSKRLKDYYQESKLMDKRYISKSINKYGHNNFSVFILETSIFTKNICILEREQYYIDLYNPEYNIIKKVTEIQKGYKHKNKSKKLISESKKGEKNIFYGKKHTEITKKHLSESKKGEKIQCMINQNHWNFYIMLIEKERGKKIQCMVNQKVLKHY